MEYKPSHIIDPDGEVTILLRNTTLTQEPAVEVPVEEPPDVPPAIEMPVEEPVREQIETDLVREPLDETYFRIQVSAKHLILASPVFKKILTGGWKESVTYLQKGSVEITAESWDIEALLILLHAIHGQQYHVPRKLTLEMLAKVAVLVDYYDCKESVYIWSTIWIDALEEKIPKTYSRDLLLWLWISCVFQLPAQFKESTSTVMSWSDGWITSLEFPIPLKVMGKGTQILKVLYI
ncbi:hypothetical protein BDV34DRAFT_213609 [Aspergillus parasiticus]|uniref:BTB domain-containing protein n=1 Tax=Aspergillus parasiticus TaxID=5067 RepID=A0A5N6DIC1_ASPPA|nr:hypothetical protein BDV34DRAFT_213609 [Aspergillus parasiticus]